MGFFIQSVFNAGNRLLTLYRGHMEMIHLRATMQSGKNVVFSGELTEAERLFIAGTTAVPTFSFSRCPLLYL